ncbi:MAG: hypothetical protein LBS89_06815 [Zoogloeaceae bacterium]|nr:hypothetical protein [Zoogloeaceae bacterium]
MKNTGRKILIVLIRALACLLALLIAAPILSYHWEKHQASAFCESLQIGQPFDLDAVLRDIGATKAQVRGVGFPKKSGVRPRVMVLQPDEQGQASYTVIFWEILPEKFLCSFDVEKGKIASTPELTHLD